MRSRELSPLQVVNSGLCIGCGSCAAQADARMELDLYGQYRPEAGVHGPSLARTCPFSPRALDESALAADLFPIAKEHPTVGRFISAYVGYVKEGEFRAQGSSGGMVSWVATELMRQGLVDGVAHVVPVDPSAKGKFFEYRISRSVDEIGEGSKSRYYPVEMAEILKEIKATPGRYAIVGVPCFIKAVQLLRQEDLLVRDRIVYTLGLFCGHMKSARFAESLALQMGIPIDEVAAVEFRLKDESRPASTYTAQLTRRDGSQEKRDWWHLVDGDWGSGFFQYSACNYCDDVIAETADISFGDAWVEPYSSDGRGTNVVVVRSPTLANIVRDAISAGRLQFNEVDEAFIVETQAAGFRQRREGLSYRLTWPKRGYKPPKRVVASSEDSRKRKLIYRSRAHISKWSHRIFWVARNIHWPAIFLGWSSAAVAFYHGAAYSRGRWGKFLERLGVS